MEAQKSNKISDLAESNLRSQEKIKEEFYLLILSLSDSSNKDQKKHLHSSILRENKTRYIKLNLIFDNPFNTHMLSTYEYPKIGYITLKERFQLKNDDYQELMGHSWASVQKRAKDDLISEKHSEKLVHNIHVLYKGLEIFGDEDAMNRWLRKFNPFLGAKPIDLLKTVTGIDMVLEEMDRLFEGSLA